MHGSQAPGGRPEVRLAAVLLTGLLVWLLSAPLSAQQPRTGRAFGSGHLVIGQRMADHSVDSASLHLRVASTLLGEASTSSFAAGYAAWSRARRGLVSTASPRWSSWTTRIRRGDSTGRAGQLTS